MRTIYPVAMGMSLQQMVDEVREALAEKLRVRGPSLEMQLRKAGRLLPRAVRRDAAYLAQAVRFAENPKLIHRVDMRKAVQAHRSILAHLESTDYAAQRREAALNLVASIAFALLTTGVLLLFVLWARGFI